MSESILRLPLNTDGFYSLEGCKRWNIPMAKVRGTEERFVEYRGPDTEHKGTKCKVRSTPFYEPDYFIKYTPSRDAG